MRSIEAVTDATADQIEGREKGVGKGGSGKAIQRERRARNLAAMGLVTREGSRYFVKTAAARGRQESYEVWRDGNGRVRCSCDEFERSCAGDPAFRCEHILAVKHSLAAKIEAEAAEGYQEDQQMKDKEEAIAQSDQFPGVAEAEAGTEPQAVAPDQATAPQSAQVVPLAFASLLRALRQPIDPRLIKSREGWTDRQGKTHWVEYIEWHTVADILDRVAPDWSHAVRNIMQIGDIVAVTASITINGVTREGVGSGPADSETGIKKAEHDALKRAAVKFGVARELYRRESDVMEENGGLPASVARDPRPKTLGDLVTPKQLWMIRNLGREIGCDVEQECQSLMQCKLEEISKRAASSFIDYLKRLQQENQPEELRQAS